MAKMRIYMTGQCLIHVRQWKLVEEICGRMNHEVTLIVPRKCSEVSSDETPFHREIRGMKVVPSLTLFSGHNRYFSPFLLNRIAKNKPHVLYAQSEPWSYDSVYNFLSAKVTRTAFVFFTWENLIKPLSPLREKFWRTIAKQANFIIAGSQGAKRVEILKGASPNKIRVFPQTGVDIEKFRPRRRSIFKEKLQLNDKLVALFAGRLVPEKGIDLLLQTWKKLIKRNRQKVCVLLICGRGPLEEDVKKFIVKEKLDPWIRFIKWVSYKKMHLLYNASDVFVYPSVPTKHWTEQFGFSMVEAMACEVPVIASYAGAIPEVIEDNVSGILVPPNDPKAVQEALRLLLENDSLRAKMGKAGRDVVKRKFSLKVIARKTVDALEDALEANERC